VSHTTSYLTFCPTLLSSFQILGLVFTLEFQLSRWEDWGHTYRFNPTTYLCLSQFRTWVSTWYVVFFHLKKFVISSRCSHDNTCQKDYYIFHLKLNNLLWKESLNRDGDQIHRVWFMVFNATWYFLIKEDYYQLGNWYSTMFVIKDKRICAGVFICCLCMYSRWSSCCQDGRIRVSYNFLLSVLSNSFVLISNSRTSTFSVFSILKSL
jgi:hypothetical protein